VLRIKGKGGPGTKEPTLGQKFAKKAGVTKLSNRALNGDGTSVEKTFRKRMPANDRRFDKEKILADSSAGIFTPIPIRVWLRGGEVQGGETKKSNLTGKRKSQLC